MKTALQQILLAGIFTTHVLIGSFTYALADDLDIPIRGVIVATKEAAVSSSITSPVLKINGRVGDVFDKGDKLIKFDCGLLQAQQRSALVELKVAKAEHSNNLLMQKRGAIAGHDVVLSKFAIERANSELAQFNEQLKECEIEAPFQGSFEEINVKLLQMPTAGTPVMRLVSHEDFEVELIVPSSWLVWIAKDVAFSLHIEELGQDVRGKIIRIGSKIDPVSQTFNVYGKLDAKNVVLIPGMSGLVEVDRYSN